MAPAGVTRIPERAADAVGTAVGLVLGDAVGDGLGVAAMDADADGDAVVGARVAQDTASAQTSTSASERIVTRLPRLLEHSTGRIEPAIRVLLEDPLAALAVEGVMLPLVAKAHRTRAQWLLADHAAGLGHHSSSMIGWCARTSCPFSTMMRRTLPLAVERISLNSFIASISPMTSPWSTWLPTWMNAGAWGEGER